MYKYIFGQDPPLATVVWQLSIEMSKQGFDFIVSSLLMHLTGFSKIPFALWGDTQFSSDR